MQLKTSIYYTGFFKGTIVMCAVKMFYMCPRLYQAVFHTAAERPNAHMLSLISPDSSCATEN